MKTLNTIKFIFFAFLIFTINVFGKKIVNVINAESDLSLSDQYIVNSPLQDTSLNEGEMIKMLDSLSNAPYFSLCKTCQQTDSSLKGIARKPIDYKVIKKRIENLDSSTPFRLSYNSEVKKFLDLYLIRQREGLAKSIGMSDLYFPLFEEALSRHNLPLELKYLAVVESALNPSIKSHAGATGLWQFMLNTGKGYGLKINSYQDQRNDPYASTEAACLYLKDLYKSYGNWELALAAYNCGPGNLNKAIKKSGYKKNYWKIWPYLPKETRGYVPAFIAVNYAMNYAEEHQIYGEKPTQAFFQNDTLQIKNRVKFDVLAKQLDLPIEVIKALNPSYKMDVIPGSNDIHVLSLPVKLIGKYLEKEKDIIHYSKERYMSSYPIVLKEQSSKNKTS